VTVCCLGIFQQCLDPSNAPAGPQPVAESPQVNWAAPALHALSAGSRYPELSLFEKDRAYDEGRAGLLANNRVRIGWLGASLGQASERCRSSPPCPRSE